MYVMSRHMYTQAYLFVYKLGVFCWIVSIIKAPFLNVLIDVNWIVSKHKWTVRGSTAIFVRDV